MRKTRRTQKAGFTLIELLIVIAIISLLAAILFPVFARARENARRASCQSNLKQIALGILQYTQDYDETWPGHTFNGFGWSYNIQPYVKSTQILQCPSEKHKANPVAIGQWGYSDYFYNAELGVDMPVPPATMFRFSRKLSDISFSGSTILAGCGGYWDSRQWANCPDQTCTIGAPTYARQSPGYHTVLDASPFYADTPAYYLPIANKHLEGGNYAFTDGHVKWMPVDKLTKNAPDGTNFTFRLN
jgi:prepilin-type N-terminal cleavage/methylation domain-containing protein/prepilin-type processing-associated H-X9-DG protein